MSLNVSMLLFPGLTPLDLVGPHEFLHRIPEAKVSLAWKDLMPVVASGGMTILPTVSLGDCPPSDLLFVPGGFGIAELINDTAVTDFLAVHGRTARFVTSVCTGSLLLGAAGLLDGYQAATHWAYMEFLPAFGAKPVRQRVVTDRNRITAGGVTSGIDFGLQVAAAVAGETFAKSLQLGLEYDPAPPFHCGHPDVAEPAIVAAVRQRYQKPVEAQQRSIDSWRARHRA